MRQLPGGVSPYFDEDAHSFRDAVRGFAASALRGFADDGEVNERLPRAYFNTVGAQGLFGLRQPVEFGGTDGSLIIETIAVEEVSRVACGLASAMMPQLLVQGLLRDHATEEQKERYLPGMIRGEIVCSIAMTEPDAGSDVRSITTALRKSGGGLQVSGRKTYITNGPVADVVVLLARDEEGAEAGYSLVLVEADDAGFDRGTKLAKLGNRASEVAELGFDDVAVKPERIIGNRGKAFETMRHAIAVSRIIFAARSLGLAQCAYEVGRDYANTRETFGRPLIRHQLVADKLAEVHLDLTHARLATAQAAWQYDSGYDVALIASQAKLVASEAATRITDRVLQIHGGMGYMMESPVQQYWRDARLLTISEGTSEIQRLEIARHLRS